MYMYMYIYGFDIDPPDLNLPNNCRTNL